MYKQTENPESIKERVIDPFVETAQIISDLSQRKHAELEIFESHNQTVRLSYLEFAKKHVDNPLQHSELPRMDAGFVNQRPWLEHFRNFTYADVALEAFIEERERLVKQDLAGRFVNIRPVEGVDPSTIFTPIDREIEIPKEVRGKIANVSVTLGRLCLEAENNSFYVFVFGDDQDITPTPKIEGEFIEPTLGPESSSD